MTNRVEILINGFTYAVWGLDFRNKIALLLDYIGMNYSHIV
ncbi:hypothetical protein AsAng_0054060 [Aureispira anguillae]|uniref:Uncharacterized protein n=1 Tax=Aureispira anguillae TaxID=2864201 RepID=A0A915YK93_9BACT|nr:hypothetical protein AsAng_0054060 [Aureispira anguillae]